MSLKHSEITDKIIRAFYAVYNKLGYGFAEKVYENALRIELRELGLTVIQQQPIKVYYSCEIVGEYYADMIIENCIIVELKAAQSISDAHEAQLLNYLKATKIEVGLLLNFGKKPEYRRKYFTNDKKGLMESFLEAE